MLECFKGGVLHEKESKWVWLYTLLCLPIVLAIPSTKLWLCAPALVYCFVKAIKGQCLLGLGLPEQVTGKYAKPVYASYCIGILLCAASLIALAVMGGGPRSIDGNFYIVSHGAVVKEISQIGYFFLTRVEAAAIGGGNCMMASLVFGYEIRA